jgi:serine O-acetyltransferase
LVDAKAFLARSQLNRPPGLWQNAETDMRTQVKAGNWATASPDASDLIALEKGSDPFAPTSPARIEQRESPGLWRLLYDDYRRYRAAGARSALSVVALTQGFWASAVFRASNYALGRFTWPGVRAIVKPLCLMCQKFVEIFTGISIPATCTIGSGLYIGHFGGIFVDSDCRLGKNCNLAQGVTIGKGGRGDLRGVPVLGDRVHVGANAVILGKINIGNDAVIGPGAVVMSSVPPCGVAVGNPARVVALDGSFEFVHYDQMETDPERTVARRSQLSRAPESGNKA